MAQTETENKHRGPLEWHYLRTKFHENLPSGSEVISGGDTKTGDLISLLSFLENSLKAYIFNQTVWKKEFGSSIYVSCR
jgi:hypothetical protein